MKSGEVKLFAGILIVALVLVGVAVIPTLVNGTGPEKPPPPPNPWKLLIPPGSHIRGNPHAPFALVEFSDYQ